MSSALYQPFPMLAGRRAQVWRHQPAFRRPRHFHEEPELNIVFAGWAKMGVGAHEVVMKPGDVLFQKPAQDHVMLDCSDDLDLFVAAATPELSARFASGTLPVGTATLSLPAQEAHQVLESLSLLGKVNSDEPHEEVVGSLFEWALPRAPSGHTLARRGLNSLVQNEAGAASDLARKLGVDASELSRNFAHDLGMKFVDARARVRLFAFVKSVDAGHSLTRAAAEHFGSYAQCHRVFRRYLSCSPRDFFGGKRLALAEATF
jgi:AraC-like DNA-binding protein